MKTTRPEIGAVGRVVHDFLASAVTSHKSGWQFGAWCYHAY
jgi:hypothetical protein